ncbi:MAG: HAD hydrolase family protein, partial [Sarcina sp.]
MYKLIALDMDGTLLNSEKKITERTKEAIRKAREKGVYVVLASGRPIDGLLKYLEELDLISDDDYVLS